MRLVYFAPSDIQVARVDRQCIVNFCDALNQLGVDVELVAIGIRLVEGERTAQHPLDLYRIREPFPVRIVPVPVSQTSPDVWIGLNRFVVHTWRAIRETLSASNARPTVFYTKNYGPALALLALRTLRRRRLRVAFEPHLPPPTRLHAAILRACDNVFANTFQLAADLIAEHELDRSRVTGTHQGVDLEMYDELRTDAGTARRALGLPVDKQLVVYTGKVVFGYREVEYILDAARTLRDRTNVLFVIVGGRVDHVERYREQITNEGLTNVMFAGFVAPNEVQAYQFAADILLMYYPSGIAINKYRSPGKLFEYMAAGRPVISVDFAVLREVIGTDDPVAVMVPEDSPDALASAIGGLLDNPELRSSLAQRALVAVSRFSWRSRAQLIIDSINAKGPAL
ncbi:MAG: glycosyltransferase [bacterium]|nr:glycosyltransferase [Candidatus Kapabacteria bacterium]